MRREIDTGVVQVSKKIPFDDPNVLLGVRVMYVASNLIIFGLYYYILMNIKKKKGKQSLRHNSSMVVGRIWSQQ